LFIIETRIEEFTCIRTTGSPKKLFISVIPNALLCLRKVLGKKYGYFGMSALPISVIANAAQIRHKLFHTYAAVINVILNVIGNYQVIIILNAITNRINK